MTFYSYQTPEGWIDTVDHELNLDLFPVYTLLNVQETKPVDTSMESREPLYMLQRRKAYPSIGDQLDALWKGGEAMAEMQAMIQAVKAQYPKPT